MAGRAIYPFLPLPPEHALSIWILSYDGTIYFGFAGDRDVDLDLDDLAAALRGGALRAAGAERLGEEEAGAEGEEGVGEKPGLEGARPQPRWIGVTL